MVALAQWSNAAIIASQDFGLANFSSPTDFDSVASSQTHTSTGLDDLGFSVDATVDGAGVWRVNGSEHFRMSHLSSTSDASDLAFTVNGGGPSTLTGFIPFDAVDLTGFANNTMSLFVADNSGSTNTNDDDLVIRLFLNGSSTGTIIFDTRRAGTTAGTVSADDAMNSATYNAGTLSYTFDPTVTSVQLRVDAAIDDDGNDGYFIDDIVFSGDAIPEPSVVLLMMLSAAGYVMRRKR